MITVKDVVDRLSELDQDIPVYWGIGELPCWILKEDATIDDFPMRIDCINKPRSLPEYYLYFGDFGDARRFAKEAQDLWSKNIDLTEKIRRLESKHWLRKIFK